MNISVKLHAFHGSVSQSSTFIPRTLAHQVWTVFQTSLFPPWSQFLAIKTHEVTRTNRKLPGRPRDLTLGEIWLQCLIVTFCLHTQCKSLTDLYVAVLQTHSFSAKCWSINCLPFLLLGFLASSLASLPPPWLPCLLLVSSLTVLPGELQLAGGADGDHGRGWGTPQPGQRAKYDQWWRHWWPGVDMSDMENSLTIT